MRPFESKSKQSSRCSQYTRSVYSVGWRTSAAPFCEATWGRLFSVFRVCGWVRSHARAVCPRPGKVCQVGSGRGDVEFLGELGSHAMYYACGLA